MSEIASEKIFLFIGVTTSQSSSVESFPKWMSLLGCPEVKMEGVDFVLNDSRDRYRSVLHRMREQSDVLGGLVTSHKISLVDAGRDLFDELMPFADLLGEVSCIYKRDGRLIGETMDAFAGGAALTEEIGMDYFSTCDASVFILGAGGAATGLTVDLLSKEVEASRPRRLILVDRSQDRLDRLEGIVKQMDSDVSVEFLLSSSAEQNDDAIAELSEGSVVVNATGMGKDTPGSPVTDAVVFPRKGQIWELNYRGERRFLQQAGAQSVDRALHVFDGWSYFVHGWSSIIGRALNVEIDDDVRREMGEIARVTR